MGTGSYIVRGLGNEASFNSASRGAGRKMSRNAARRPLLHTGPGGADAGRGWTRCVSHAQPRMPVRRAFYGPSLGILRLAAFQVIFR
ncbi:RtcB family protein [Streptomyces sp. HNM0663]|uniref:3'-phosphate/5'-hydroxy nucleic acid ligase n=1 Tax=Streptomyces chengmaiensis TaxID=3040919 RepID=A0ABT6HSU5_9ACTN|nr:RtcB family protein [Streptomyces chengmaiensis]